MTDGQQWVALADVVRIQARKAQLAVVAHIHLAGMFLDTIDDGRQVVALEVFKMRFQLIDNMLGGVLDLKHSQAEHLFS